MAGFIFDWAAMTSQVMFIFSLEWQKTCNKIFITQTKLLITYALIFVVTEHRWQGSGHYQRLRVE